MEERRDQLRFELRSHAYRVAVLSNSDSVWERRQAL
jgi:hypothetical protein